jgi:adenylate kinase family enzyme
MGGFCVNIREVDFPIFNTKELADGNTYNVNDPVERRKYFKAKVGTEIEEIKSYLDHNTFVGFLLAKKQAGKGTYSKMLQEVIGTDRLEHISVGDIVRKVFKAVEDPKEMTSLVEYMQENYRGFVSIQEEIDAFLGFGQDKLISTEFILTLVKREIEQVGRKGLFIDGFPRSLDQVSYSLYFRNLINFRDDPDFFILIDIPMSVIDERMKTRVVCPVCHTSRSPKLLPTKFVEYDKEADAYYLVCDNAECPEHGKARLVGKAGDDKGVELIKDRLRADGELIERAMTLVGVPRILLRNGVPVDQVSDFVEDYEITPEYYYERDSSGAVTTKERPFTVLDDKDVESNSLLAAPVVVALIKQLHTILLG